MLGAGSNGLQNRLGTRLERPPVALYSRRLSEPLKNVCKRMIMSDLACIKELDKGTLNLYTPSRIRRHQRLFSHFAHRGSSFNEQNYRN